MKLRDYIEKPEPKPVRPLYLECDMVLFKEAEKIKEKHELTWRQIFEAALKMLKDGEG